MKTFKILMMAVLTIVSLSVLAQTKRGYKDTTKHTQFYTCSMHDSIAMKKPGNCPICGMKLNLSKKEEAHITKSKNYVCPSHPQTVADKPGKCSVCGMSLNLSPKEKAKLGYACPMHPNEKSDKSGKCPNCGMALTPLKKS